MKYRPGELFDINGVPIYSGDLLRTFHFGRLRGRKHYLYHTAVFDAKMQSMRMVPTSSLEPTLAGHGGDPLMYQQMIDSNAIEVIAGCGPEFGMDFRRRKKTRRAS